MPGRCTIIRGRIPARSRRAHEDKDETPHGRIRCGCRSSLDTRWKSGSQDSPPPQDAPRRLEERQSGGGEALTAAPQKPCWSGSAIRHVCWRNHERSTVVPPGGRRHWPRRDCRAGDRRHRGAAGHASRDPESRRGRFRNAAGRPRLRGSRRGAASGGLPARDVDDRPGPRQPERHRERHRVRLRQAGLRGHAHLRPGPVSGHQVPAAGLPDQHPDHRRQGRDQHQDHHHGSLRHGGLAEVGHGRAWLPHRLANRRHDLRRPRAVPLCGLRTLRRRCDDDRGAVCRERGAAPGGDLVPARPAGPVRGHRRRAEARVQGGRDAPGDHDRHAPAGHGLRVQGPVRRERRGLRFPHGAAAGRAQAVRLRLRERLARRPGRGRAQLQRPQRLHRPPVDGGDGSARRGVHAVHRATS